MCARCRHFCHHTEATVRCSWNIEYGGQRTSPDADSARTELNMYYGQSSINIRTELGHCWILRSPEISIESLLNITLPCRFNSSRVEHAWHVVLMYHEYRCHFVDWSHRFIRCRFTSSRAECSWSLICYLRHKYMCMNYYKFIFPSTINWICLSLDRHSIYI